VVIPSLIAALKTEKTKMDVEDAISRDPYTGNGLFLEVVHLFLKADK
jgi:hypothetical protein